MARAMRTQNATAVAPAKPTTVVVVDDHHAIRSALCMLLNAAPDLVVVGEATAVVEACRVIEAHDPDVVLLDLRLQGEDGLEVARRMRDQHARARILVLSASDGIADLRAALDAGVDGFLSKCTTQSALVDGVRRIAAGQRVVGEELVYSLARSAEAPPAPARRSLLHRGSAPHVGADRTAGFPGRSADAPAAAGTSGTGGAGRVWLPDRY